MIRSSAQRLSAFAVLAAVLLTLGFGCRQKSEPVDGPIEQWTAYTSSRFRATFKHPSSWLATAGQREDDSLSGATGFVFLSAVGRDKPTVAEAVLSETRHLLKPYGTNPIVVPTRVDGQEGRLVLPSSDQPAEMKNQAMLMIVYPKPLKFSTETYSYLAVYADKDHIQKIARTLRFLEPKEQAKGAVAGSVTLGPTCPIDAIGRPCVASKESYASRKIIVYLEDGKTEIKQADIDSKGLYRVELNSGTYVIDINHAGIDRSSDVPRKVAIEAGRTALLDIKIDTGIR